MKDIFEKLVEERTIFLTGEVTDELASAVIAQMLYLESADPEKDICLYINSPGGSVSSGLAIYDTMNFIRCDVVTICVGMAASMGAFLLTGGTMGKRFSLPNSSIMLHQPSGGVRGQATDISIVAENILKTRRKINGIIAERCGKSVKKITADFDRDCWMDPKEALEYGLIDKIIANREAA